MIDLPKLEEIAAAELGGTFFLASTSAALVLAMGEYLEERKNWLGASNNGLTDVETDRIDAIVAELMDNVMNPMIGEVKWFATENIPSNCLPFDGGSYLRTDYPALYAVLHPNLILDADTFYLPATANTFTIAAGSTEGMETVVGQQGGSFSKQLEIENLPPHTHITTTSYEIGAFGALNGELVPFFVPVLDEIPIESAPTGGDEFFDVTNPWTAFVQCIVAL